jgi:hypothetical protein
MPVVLMITTYYAQDKNANTERKKQHWLLLITKEASSNKLDHLPPEGYISTSKYIKIVRNVQQK